MLLELSGSIFFPNSTIIQVLIKASSVLILLGLSFTSLAQRPPPEVIEVLKLEFPVVEGVVYNFGFVEGGVPSVPISDGIFMAGLNSWYIPPNSGLKQLTLGRNESEYITISEAKNELAQFEIHNVKNNSSSFRMNIPQGVYGVSVSGESIVLYGYINHSWKIYSLLYGTTLSELYESEDLIADVEICQEGILFVSNNQLYLLNAEENDAIPILKFEVDLDGIALLNNGAIAVSSEDGIYIVDNLQSQNVILLTREIHGVIKSTRDALFVLSQDHNAIFRLKLQ